MTEHRESPRPFSRLVASPTARRVAVNRVGLALAGGLGALVLLVLLVSYGRRLGADRLAADPAYRIAFTDIRLEPPPPPWYRGGPAAFLEHVREGAQAPEVFSALGADLEALDRSFRLYPWVRRVSRIERAYPNRILVRLEYREPVARWDRPGTFVLDAENVILPRDDVAPESAGALLLLANTPPPADPRPGEQCKAANPATGVAEVDPKVKAAARLAGFVEARRHPPSTAIPSLDFVAIHPMNRRLLFVEAAPRIMIRWGETPGEEEPGALGADQKWAMLREWAGRRPRASLPGAGQLLLVEFTKAGAKSQLVVRRRPGPAPK